MTAAAEQTVPRKLRVGVTLYIREGGQSLWENGIFQNCFFLLMLLNRSPAIDRAFIVNGGPCKAEDASNFLALAPAPVLTMDEAMQELDVLIELSAQIGPEWGTAFRARGGRIVAMHVANDYVIDMERMVFNLPHGTLFSGVPYDVVWTLPAFEQSCASYYGVGFNAPVKVMQHLWSPYLLDKSIAARGPDATFAYCPGRIKWRLAVLEPNICTVKTCHLPMMLSDMAYRHAPKSIEYLRVYNSLHMKEHATFVEFARSLDLVRHGIATFEARFPIFEIMTQSADCIVSHHWQNAQNYVYYEALHGGFPLIHNSHLLDDCGYAYPTFDCEQGALALLQAFSEHDVNFDSYKRNAAKFLNKLDPCSDLNIENYTRELVQLFA